MLMRTENPCSWATSSMLVTEMGQRAMSPMEPAMPHSLLHALADEDCSALQGQGECKRVHT
jgi:hypothetical protein